MTIAILGAGAFGTALAVALAQEGRPVTLWARDPYAVSRIRDHRESPRLPRVQLPEMVSATTDLNTAAKAETVLVSVPTQSLRGVLQRIDTPMSGRPLVLCCKGIDLETGLGVSDAARRVKPGVIPAVLTGPSFAADIAKGLPTALTLACADETIGLALQHQLSTSSLRLYRTSDVTGAELGGALKNVIAIACGACIGAGLGDSARAALMTRGFAEMTRLAEHLGAKPDTLAGLSGLGDLTLTCTSDLSRNYRYGLSLGRGEAFDPEITVEGSATARAAAQLARDNDISAPIATVTARLTTGVLTVPEAMDDLLSRPLKEE
ncbi:NAD(P)H-dependent glycerol-3-phosphate dehydrogenase [Sagittula stellata]|uniref:Glycerol-3-phosphate dehydrogenase [NAD(P)+] n=1 Tax=Sagittula stellata (strain ATCC 700073 / DSM 11524 / E-37) TaxID=388399 RepID=A3K8T9_SAGS3|nr:NAD(P)H-dependent glycerol-3-phosphate dehydrogenase [Sagittula stellata]EBA06322.1 glycerol-3-phosphate dehydrogenase (NAD(P)+) [Sagittula stellata E-37]